MTFINPSALPTTLVQTAYTDITTPGGPGGSLLDGLNTRIQKWTFDWASGYADDVRTHAVNSYKPLAQAPYTTGEWYGAPATELVFGKSGYTTFVSNAHIVRSTVAVGDPFHFDDLIEYCVIEIPQMALVSMSPYGDELHLPWAVAIAFSPVLPSWVCDPTISHVVYNPGFAAEPNSPLGPIFYSDADPTGIISPLSLDFPHYMVNANGGFRPAAGPLEDRFVRFGQGTPFKMMYHRINTGEIYAAGMMMSWGQGWNLGGTPVGFNRPAKAGPTTMHRHFGFGSCRVQACRQGVSSSTPADFQLTARWIGKDTESTSGTGSPVTVIASTPWVFQLTNGSTSVWTIDFTTDIEALAPAGCCSISLGGNNVGNIATNYEYLIRPSYPLSAVRDGLTEHTFPGRVIKILDGP